jgi:NAD(P)-dependent dehydrogenase (short-subunit alcohol dehydrogenase family)
MQNVVITGSTRGIGLGLADSFLGLGCAVVVSARSESGIEAAVAELAARHGAGRIIGRRCDVTDFEQVQALWDVAVARFGKVDMWVNNAGLGNMYRPAWEQTPGDMKAIVCTNVLGTMYGTRVAFLGMCAQGFGQIFNMEGFGSKGQMRPGLTVYGSTKASVRYFTRSMLAEMGDSPVRLGTLSPGMVLTEMLTDAYDDPAELERYKRIFNILGDRVETVTPWLARQMLSNQKNGAHIRWLTTPKLVMRFLTTPFSRRDLFVEKQDG